MIRLLVVDDGTPVCHQTIQALVEQSDIGMVGRVNHPEAAVLFGEDFEVALIGSDLPQDGAYQLTRTLAMNGACSQVVVLETCERIQAPVRFLEAGALGYLGYSCSVEECLRVVRGAAHGEAYLPPDVAGLLIRRLAEMAAWSVEAQPLTLEASSLTRREREILRLISRDYTNQDIAKALIIEVGTVKNHVHNILSKLKVSSRDEAAAYILRHPTRPPVRFYTQ